VNRVQLSDLIDSNTTFLSWLASPTIGCITWPQRDHLVNIPQPCDRNDKLIEFLTRTSVASYNLFTRVLSIRQAQLVPLLLTDGGETMFRLRVTFFGYLSLLLSPTFVYLASIVCDFA